MVEKKIEVLSKTREERGYRAWIGPDGSIMGCEIVANETVESDGNKIGAFSNSYPVGPIRKHSNAKKKKRTPW